MRQAQESDRAQILGKAIDAAGRQGPPDPGLASLLTRYLRHVSVEDLTERDPIDLAGAVASHRQLAGHRPQGTASVRVFTPTVEVNGWSTGHTVVEVVTDDTPFLVDSVTAELARQDRAIHLVVHPQILVRRDVTGRLLEVLDEDCTETALAELPRDVTVESWIHVEIDRESDPAGLEAVSSGVRRVLDDVRVAVEDWPRMKDRARRIAEGLGAAPPPGIPAEDADETRELLLWLADGHFTFIGYREYRLVEGEGTTRLVAVQGSGLGVLRYDQTAASSAFDRLTLAARERARQRELLVLTKANSRATVHRSAYLDYIGVKVFDAAGEVVGERRFLGLFASSAYTDSVRRIPVVSRKVDAVLHRAGFAPESHSGKDLLGLLETYPRDELFEIGVDALYEVAIAVMHLQERRRTRLFMRTDSYGRYVSCLVYLPRDRYTTTVRLRMAAILREAFEGVSVDYTARVSESVLARLHFVVRVAAGGRIPDVDHDELEARLVEAARSWDEDLAEALRAEAGEEEAARLLRTWGHGFPESYKEDYPARVAVADLRRIEELDAADPEAIGMNLYEPVGAGGGVHRFKLYRTAPLTLTQVLPYLSNLGVEVVDEWPHLVRRSDGRCVYVYDFGLRYAPPPDRPDLARDAFCEAFAAAWSGRSESDGFDRLVLLAGLHWRQVVVLRACAKYLRQAGTTFSQEYLEQCLRANVGITRRLVRLFEARFDPHLTAQDAPSPSGSSTSGSSPSGPSASGPAPAPVPLGADGRHELTSRIVADIRGELDRVASLDQDRILRAYLGLILATTRTNAFQRAQDGGPKPYVSFKFDPALVVDLPAPRPAYEIFVYSPRVEGVHLRFGKVARGGLRWSDRREDFRTEILGLVKAQAVKNAVIVPTGAKGGFVAKQLPDPAADREAWLAEGVAAYRLFIRGLLDLTDNLVTVPADPARGQVVVPPPDVVRHDGDDTYLVVAADKGTATFSDIANAVAIEYGFWLGDAFASGGSVGYDHKAMGITARGAWVSVERHFRELGKDVRREPFTVVGIGDMSGDVFGNGMLLSPQIRLVAAFDHRHVFLDPDPDPATSFAERSRLFALPRSSWADYDATLISPGGGVHPRTAKSVPISPQVATRLGILPSVTAMTPAELISAILTAPADLLWNGGIGTYVKSSREANAAVGDKANDAIRIDGRQLRVRVVGEGGNLGLTQLGRVEAALRGVRVNTDAIDNSAGVDCSDHEVNIKILLDRVVATGDLTVKQRGVLLAEFTDEVGALVLRDNYEQNVLLGNARKQSPGMVPVHQRFVRALEARGHLDRALEFLPDDAALAARAEEGLGLTSPEFSVLVAYAKNTLKADLLSSPLPDDPWFTRTLHDYFPARLAAEHADRLAVHPLRREIITTCLVNEMVNRGGITFAYRAQEETGASADLIASAYAVCREVFGLRDYVHRVEELDGRVSTDAQTALYLAFRRLLDRSVRWFLQTRPGVLDIGEQVARFGPVVAELGPRMGDLLVGAEHKALAEQVDALTGRGIPVDLALTGASLLNVYQLLDITEIATSTGLPPADVAEIYFTLSERYAVDAMLVRISGLGRPDRWQALARASLRYDLYAALESLTVAVLGATPAGGSPRARILAWEQANVAAVTRATQTLEEIRRLERGDLASLSVALRTLRGVVRSTS